MTITKTYIIWGSFLFCFVFVTWLHSYGKKFIFLKLEIIYDNQLSFLKLRNYLRYWKYPDFFFNY